jgi:hypothetical protein
MTSGCRCIVWRQRGLLENVPAAGTFHPVAGSLAGDVLNSVMARQIGSGRAIASATPMIA